MALGRPGKKLSNADWESPIDPDAKIAMLKDGRIRLAYKPEHALDLDTGAIIAAELHEADLGDTVSLPVTLEAAMEQLAALEAAPTPEAPSELITDKGYHSPDTLKRLADGPWKTRVSQRRVDGVLRFCAGTAIMLRGGRSITIANACCPAWRAKPSGCAPNGWSAASV
jgi:transposase